VIGMVDREIAKERRVWKRRFLLGVKALPPI